MTGMRGTSSARGTDAQTGLVASSTTVGSEGTRWVLAVSGGVDSMVLLDMVERSSNIGRCSPPLRVGLNGEAFPKRNQLVVAHMNHGLRDAESDADEEFVKAWCRKKSLRFVSKKLPADAIRSQAKRSVEEAARRIRYDWLEDVAKENRCDAILTAHHADDQVETIVHQWVRGSALRGLQGMQAIRELESGVKLLRPLLTVTREEIVGWATDHDVAYREDASNQSDEFTRNRIRKSLANVDDLKELTDELLQFSKSAADVVGQLDCLCGRLDRRAAVTRTSQHVLLRVEALAGLPGFIVSHYFTWVWMQQQWPRQKMTARHWDSLVKAVGADGCSRFQLPGWVEVRREGGCLRLTKL